MEKSGIMYAGKKGRVLMFWNILITFDVTFILLAFTGTRMFRESSYRAYRRKDVTRKSAILTALVPVYALASWFVTTAGIRAIQTARTSMSWTEVKPWLVGSGIFAGVVLAMLAIFLIIRKFVLDNVVSIEEEKD
mgnify:FL=1